MQHELKFININAILTDISGLKSTIGTQILILGICGPEKV